MQEREDNLTEEQQNALNTILTGCNVFLTGGAGTGKSFLIKKAVKELEQRGKSVLLVAPTGAAASEIEGVTIHRAFGFSSTVCITEKTMKIMIRVSKPLLLADVIVIDEISMLRMDLFDAVVTSIRKAEKKTGKKKQLIVIGDFFQLPPILSNKHGDQSLIEMYYNKSITIPYAFLGNEWESSNFTPIILSNSIRQADSEFIYNLNLLRVCDERCIDYFNSHCHSTPFPNSVSLYSTNKASEAESKRHLDILPGQAVKFATLFNDKLQPSDTDDIPKRLVLKVGARVMVTANEAIRTTTETVGSKKRTPYHNGSLGTVVAIGKYVEDPTKDYVAVRLDTGGSRLFYRRQYTIYTYSVNKDRIKKEVLGTYAQFPLKLAYALTIHKSQGQTYETANISPNCRTSGQLYVALSRVKSVDGIHLMQKISRESLVLSPLVKKFYDSLGSPSKATEHEKKKGGRPSRYPSGSTHLRVPQELSEPLQQVLDKLYPAASDKTPDTVGITHFLDLLNQFLEKR